MGRVVKTTIKKLTNEDLMREACESTFLGKSKQTLKQIYKSEHSPARTQLFWITIDGLPLFVSTHLIRHHVGSQPFALTHRVDRKGGKDLGRDTPTTLSLLINAQSLIDMAKLRLCMMASKETRDVMEMIKSEVSKVDADLAEFMVKKCVYRNGFCGEIKSCAFNYTDAFRKELIEYSKNF